MDAFLNPGMLLGLAGLTLPVFAHLLSRRKYDVVEWGAMQFLELGRETRRRFRLEQLLLLLLRMGLILLVVFALSRPWISSRLAASWAPGRSRDVVIIIDGSSSMSWEGRAENPHARAVQWAHDLLDELQPGDSVALLEARDLVRPVVIGLTRDHDAVREALDQLPPPGGSSRLTDAVTRAAGLLRAGEHLVRDVVILTDLQAGPWQPGRTDLWRAIDEQLAAAPVKPGLWVADVAQRTVDQPINFSAGPIELSRERSVPGFPVRLRSKVQASGIETTVYRKVFLEIDGQRLDDRTLTVRLDPAAGEMTEVAIDFEYRFASPGSHLASIVLEADDFPADDQSHTAISVADSIPVLLVDGAGSLDPALSETYFAQKALSPELNPMPLVRAHSILPGELSKELLAQCEVVVLANVARLSDVQIQLLQGFVSAGGGLLVTAGDQSSDEFYAAWQMPDQQPMLPARLVSVQRGQADPGQSEPGPDDGDPADRDPAGEIAWGVHIASDSLELPWLRPFRSENGGELALVRFTSWWNLELITETGGQTPPGPPAPGGTNAIPPAAGQTPPGPPAAGSGGEPEADAADGKNTPVVVMRLETGDPLLVLQRRGKGQVALLACPLDADWSTLPARTDFVPLLHELMFQLAPGGTGRNVEAGGTLVAEVPRGFPFDSYRFYGPGRLELPPVPAGTMEHPLARLDQTDVPGVYELRFRDQTAAGGADDAGEGAARKRGPGANLKPGAGEQVLERFVVESDRSETDLRLLNEEETALLSASERMRFISKQDDLTDRVLHEDSRVEIWPVLLFLFLLLLVGELIMTRRLVRGGHHYTDEEALPAENSQSTASPGAG